MGVFCSIEGGSTMKKENWHKFLFVISALLVVGFAIAFSVDAYKYNTGGFLGSAPLYAYALVDAVEYLLPSAIAFVAALICRKKFAKREKKK